jgi:hypothetical protein
MSHSDSDRNRVSIHHADLLSYLRGDSYNMHDSTRNVLCDDL